jgi:RHH-type proline utilization regulon transcriptional repressor/proline dehydrogenase/delta 1-pyrroline-5-carboxylate dehydrogenase
MVRLVKGAYWDSEIKRAQVDGLEDYPVYTRKVHTDISYIACAEAAGRARGRVPPVRHPQRQTLATIYHLAGSNYYAGQYEFQCLHGMGEPLYEQVVGAITAASWAETSPWAARAASTPPWARTKPCWPTWCAACWKTAPTPRS